MAKIKLLLDTRSKKKNGTYPIRLRILHKDKQAYFSTGISIEKEHWNEAGSINRCKLYPTVSRVNHTLRSTVSKAQDIIDKLDVSRKSSFMTAMQIKNHIEQELSGKTSNLTFSSYFEDFVDQKSGRTKQLYESTKGIVDIFTNGRTLFFEDITLGWLNRFDNWLVNDYDKKASPNTRITYFKHIRSVINSAMKERLISRDLYPFIDFTFPKPTVTKKGLNASNIMAIYNLELKEFSRADFVRDTFILSFCLVGINNIDLYHLEKLSNDGRVEYTRRKTGRFYSIMAYPLAISIMNKWRGKNKYLIYSERYSSIKYMNRNINFALKDIGEMVGVKGLTMYHARHSWATIAAQLDVPKETIAAALGHGAHTITDIYIDFNSKKVDEANMKLLKYVGLFN